MLKIIRNPDSKVYDEVTKAVQDNDNYCPCEIMKSADTRCPCKIFREQTTAGECHCGRYVKIEEEQRE